MYDPPVARLKAGEYRWWNSEGAESIQLLVKDPCSSAGCSAAGSELPAEGRKRGSRDIRRGAGVREQAAWYRAREPSFLQELWLSGAMHGLNAETQLGKQQRHRTRSCPPKALDLPRAAPTLLSQSTSQGRQTPTQALCLGEGAEKDKGKCCSKLCTCTAKNLITCHLLSLSHTLLPQGLADFFPHLN